jgi:hypothetical protein
MEPIVDPYPTVSADEVKAYLLKGDDAFFKHKYYRALNYYLLAWNLFPKILDPSFYPNHMNTQLMQINATSQLVSASAQVLRYIDSIGPSIPIISPLEPPEELVQLSEKYAGPINKAKQYYHKSVLYTKLGVYDLAQENIKKALEASGNDEEIKADTKALLGAIEFGRGNISRCLKNIQDAMDSYRKSNRLDAVASMQHNLGVVSTIQGDTQEAARFLKNSSVTSPKTLNWQVTDSLNPGTSSVTRPMGKTGLQLLVSGGTQNWVGISSNQVRNSKQSVTIIKNDAGVKVDLQSLQSATKSIEDLLLKPRKDATTINELEMYLWDSPYQFMGYLAHIHLFVLPLALGDTYFAIGDYEQATTFYIKARDYMFININIELPMVWCKLARTFLELGNQLYRREDKEGAQKQYEKIVGKRTESGEIIFSGPLYSGTFASYKDEMLELLSSSSVLDSDSIDYILRAIVLEAKIKNEQIAMGMNYMGFSENIIPIHSWRYLQNLARYFANQAIQAERAYINFEDKSEQEEFQRLTLEQAVESQKAALNIEQLRVSESQANLNVWNANLDMALERLENGKELIVALETKNKEELILDDMMAWIQQEETWAALWEQHNITWDSTDLMYYDRAARFENWYQDLSAWKILNVNEKWYFPLSEIIRRVAVKRSQITHDYEEDIMERDVEERGLAVNLARAQKDSALASLAVTEAQRDLAKLNLNHAEEQLEFFNTEEFTPELWNNLAQTQRGISRQYLDWAIGAAFLMERAFEYEYDTKVNRIRFDYDRSDLHGLLAGDFLLMDIDQFSYDRILETEKPNPVVVTISLAERYPFLFRQEFQKTGRIDFETTLEDFERWFPGSCLSKLRQVEVAVEGLIGKGGLHGTLTNSGTSYYRDRNGNRRIRSQKPETMVLSRYSSRMDEFIFTSKDEDVLRLFQNSGVASGWILNIPPEANDINYYSITDVYLLFNFDVYYSEHVSNLVRAEMAATSLYESTLGLGLRFQYPDEFFGFQESGEITFMLSEASLQFDHTRPTIRKMNMVIQTEKGTSPLGLIIDVTTAAGAINLEEHADINGMITAAGPNNDVLKHKELIDTWTVKIDKDKNIDAFSTGFTWEKVKNIFFFFEYDYTPRGRIESILDLSVDPLQSFEAIDDPMAVNDSPSNWVYDPLEHRIEQLSNVHAPNGNMNMNTDPDKPGTYLIHKQTADWPQRTKDLVINCLVNSGDDDGIGFIFRFQDVDNFYFFIMDSKRKYRRIGKKVQGVFQELDTPAVETQNGYDINQNYKLTIAAVGDAFKAYLDGKEILSGQDRTDELMKKPGRVGFYSWGNTAARFLDLNMHSV